jgi:hypothetical protein
MAHSSRTDQDRRERDLARQDDGALVRYEAHWQRKLRRLQRSFPERWRVAGLSDEEVRDRLTLRLVEVIRSPTDPDWLLERAGKEWGLLVVQKELGELRRRHRLGATSVDFSDVPACSLSLTQEEQCLDQEAARARALAAARAERSLTRPQRAWLAALKLSTAAGAVFDASQEPNLSAAARLLGKNRSSAQRGYWELKARFARERKRLE